MYEYVCAKEGTVPFPLSPTKYVYFITSFCSCLKKEQKTEHNKK
jgi:hypothetical protein